MTLLAEVLVAYKPSAEEAVQLSNDFEEIGLIANVREVSPRRSLDFAWVLLAALPWKPFVDKLLQEFASDAYKRLKIITTRIFDRRQLSPETKQRLLVLQDTLTGVQVVLEPDLPAEGYRQLLGFDLSAIQRGPLHYDQHRKQWCVDVDETAKASSRPTTP